MAKKLVTTGGVVYARDIIGLAGGPAPGAASSSIQQSTTDLLTASVITTTETAFATVYSIPASVLVANKLFRVTACFEEITSAAAATQRLRIRLGGIGGTIVYDSTAVAPTNSIVSRSCCAQFFIMGTAAAGASVNVITAGSLAQLSPTWPGSLANTIDQPVAIATNAAQEITFTMQFGANTAGNSVALHILTVEELN